MNDPRFSPRLPTRTVEEIEAFALAMWGQGELPSFLAFRTKGFALRPQQYYGVITAAWKKAHGIPHHKPPSEATRKKLAKSAQEPVYTANEIREFVLALWTKGIFPSYLTCKEAGLICGEDRFYEIVSKSWKHEHQILRTNKFQGLDHFRNRSRIDPTKPAMIAAGLGPKADIMPPKPVPIDPPRDPVELAAWERKRDIKAWRAEFRAVRARWNNGRVVI